MDGVYVIFILMVHHLSFFLYFYILEELYLMLHIFTPDGFSQAGRSKTSLQQLRAILAMAMSRSA